jgi:hypothetical protein
MATFLERATGHDAGAGDLLELPFFELCLQLYAADVVPVSVFERPELNLTLQQQQELLDLLALMPNGSDARNTWRARVISVFFGARIYLAQLDDQTKVKAALGLP